MSKLLDLARLLLSRDYADTSHAEKREIERGFVEELTFAPADEIVSMLHTVLKENWIGLPVWARNLAFRLAYLQRPDDAGILREASADLLSFGPDWDDVADELKRRAEALDGGTTSG